MGVLDLLGLGQSAAAPIEAIGNVIGKVYTSEGEKLSAQEMLERLRQNPQMWASEVNKLNAQDSRLFNSGWRPSIGWVCSISLALYYIPQYTLAAYLWYKMSLDANKLIPYPIDPSSLIEIVGVMLGFGTLRTVEAIKGVIKR